MLKKRWSPTEDEFLVNNYSCLTMPVLEEKLNRTRPSISYRAFRLGLLRPKGFIYDIREEGYNRTHSFNDRFFDTVDTEIKAYLLGLIYTDGCISIHHTGDHEFYRFIYEIKETDEVLMGFFRAHLEALDYKIYRRAAKNTIRLELSSKHLFESLVQLGIVPRKSYVDIFPRNISPELLKHYVRGCFDGDGCISLRKEYKGGIVSIIGRKVFCQWLQSSLVDQGIKANIHKFKQDEDRGVLCISDKVNGSLFAQWLYQDATFFLTRKYNKFVEGGLI